MIPIEVKKIDGEIVWRGGWPMVPRKDEEVIIGQKIWHVFRVEHRVTEDRLIIIVI